MMFNNSYDNILIIIGLNWNCFQIFFLDNIKILFKGLEMIKNKLILLKFVILWNIFIIIYKVIVIKMFFLILESYQMFLLFYS